MEISGQGPAPRAATIDWFREQGITSDPRRRLPAGDGAGRVRRLVHGTRAVRHAGRWATSRPGHRLAEDGYRVYPLLATALARAAERFQAEWPSQRRDVPARGSTCPPSGERCRQPGLGRDVQSAWSRSRQRERKRGREAGIAAALRLLLPRARWPSEVVDVQRRRRSATPAAARHAACSRGRLRRVRAHASRRRPSRTDYRGRRRLQVRPMDAGAGLPAAAARCWKASTSRRWATTRAEYIHTVVEAAKLAFADREHYYGDPAFVEVPLERLLSKEYAAAAPRADRPAGRLARAAARRRARLPTATCWRRHRSAMRRRRLATATRPISTSSTPRATCSRRRRAAAGSRRRRSSPASASRSGTRGQMFYLDPAHAERARARQAPAHHADAVAGAAGRPAVHGLRHARRRPAGPVDAQFFLNVVDFGMNLQEAIDAPSVPHGPLPQLVLPARAQPSAGRHRGAHPTRASARSWPRAATRSRSTAMGERAGERGQGPLPMEGFRAAASPRTLVPIRGRQVERSRRRRKALMRCGSYSGRIDDYANTANRARPMGPL